MNDLYIIEIKDKEKEALKELLKVLHRERDAIISFSLEGIVQGNNRKEEIFNKLEQLKSEEKKIFKSVDDENALFMSEIWKTLTAEIERTMKEIKTVLQNNMKLLSFSIDYTKFSIEHMLFVINKKAEERSVLFSKVI